MKDFPTVCPPSRIPSPYSHMSIHERNSGLREVRITKGTIAKKNALAARTFFNMQNTTSYSHIYRSGEDSSRLQESFTCA